MDDRNNQSKTIIELLDYIKINGGNLVTYLSKGDNIATKDRVAASFISDKALVAEGRLETTIIQTEVNTDDCIQTKMYKSNHGLSYEGLIALLYSLRIDNNNIIEIANVSNKDGGCIISIDELGSNTDILKITTSDTVTSLVDIVINEQRHRIKEKHIINLIDTEINNNEMEIIAAAFKSVWNTYGDYEVSSNNESKYRIIESEKIVCVIHKSRLLILSINEKVELETFILKVKSLCRLKEIHCNIKITNGIIIL